MVRICIRRPQPRITKVFLPIQALRPPANQLKSIRRHRMRWITARHIFPSETSRPVQSAAVARICMHRPPRRITKVFPPIQALRPPADQLKLIPCHRMRWITARLIFPSETSRPVLSPAVARVCMRRPPPRITKAFSSHPGPSPTSYSEFYASSRL